MSICSKISLCHRLGPSHLHLSEHKSLGICATSARRKLCTGNKKRNQTSDRLSNSLGLVNITGTCPAQSRCVHPPLLQVLISPAVGFLWLLVVGRRTGGETI